MYASIGGEATLEPLESTAAFLTVNQYISALYIESSLCFCFSFSFSYEHAKTFDRNKSLKFLIHCTFEWGTKSEE